MAAPKKPASKTPPVSNDYVEDGAEKFDETDETGKESESASDAGGESVATSTGQSDTAPAKEDAPKPKRHIRDRIKDIEKRWGKEFTEIMVDVHDHVFGTSPPHDEDEKKQG